MSVMTRLYMERRTVNFNINKLQRETKDRKFSDTRVSETEAIERERIGGHDVEGYTGA